MKGPHKGSIGSVVIPPVGTGFLRETKRQDKTKWCGACRRKTHTLCTRTRYTIDRQRRPCECPCRLDELDPNL